MTIPDKYSEYVDHPRFGRRPRFTGLNPDPLDLGVRFNTNTFLVHGIRDALEAAGLWFGRDRPRRIANTAILADLSRQTAASVPVTHYFDLEVICRDCRRPFIFFAEEQRHWYEELGFGLVSDCVRCVPCRRRQQELAQQRKTYETLCAVTERTADQSLAMAAACLRLIEAGAFTRKQTARVRMLLNSTRRAADPDIQARRETLLARVVALEQGRAVD